MYVYLRFPFAIPGSNLLLQCSYTVTVCSDFILICNCSSYNVRLKSISFYYSVEPNKLHSLRLGSATVLTLKYLKK